MAQVYLVSQQVSQGNWKALGAADSIEAGVSYLKAAAIAGEAGGGPTAVFWKQTDVSNGQPIGTRVQLRADFVNVRVEAGAAGGSAFSQLYEFELVDVWTVTTP